MIVTQKNTLSSVTSLALQLISHASITPNDADCQKMISDHLARLGFSCESMRFGEVDNLFARYGKEPPLLVFAGHTDIVPPGPPNDWTTPAFEPAIRDGYLYGRGAADMKGAIASMLIAVESFIKTNPTFPGSIGFLITSDEEGPAIDGTQKVLEVLKKRGEKIDYCLIGEPSSEREVGDQVRIGRRGSLHGILTVYGKQGHVAHPQLASNPIHKSVQFLQEFTHTEWDKGNAYFPPTTLQITNIHGGNGATNVIPGELQVIFNFRFGTACTVNQLQERTKRLLHHHGLHYDVEWKIGAEPFLAQKGSLLKATQQAIKEITGLDVKLSTGGGTSDGRFFVQNGAEIVELGVSHATAHHIDECTSIKALETLEKIYQHVLRILFLSHSNCTTTLSGLS